MAHLPARSLRTALLATALSTAVAVPAAAAPSAPTTTTTITAKPAKKAGDDDFIRYRVRAGRRGQAEAKGRLWFGEGRLRNAGELFLDGRGRALVFFRFVGEDRWDRIRGRAFRTRDERDTDFRVHRFVKKVVITVCHEHRRRTFCNTREFFRDDGYRGPDRKGSKVRSTGVARGHGATARAGGKATVHPRKRTVGTRGGKVVVKRDARTGERPAR
jgi:hypothetical protein